MKEIWKDVKGYEDYEISNMGRVKTKSRPVRYVHSVTKNEHYRITEEKYLKIYLNNRTGYNFVQLYKNKKSKNFTIHRLVATNFIENNRKLPVINHINGIKTDNRVENLEWCKEEYNYAHASLTGLTARGERVSSSVLNEKCVFAIKNLVKSGMSHELVSVFFGVSHSLVTQIINNQIWSHVDPLKDKLSIKKRKESAFGKKVQLINKNNEVIKEWGSLNKAGKELGLDPSMIGKVASGKYKSYRGYVFVFEKTITGQELEIKK